MQKTVTFARIRPDGTLVRVTSDGSDVSMMPEQVKKTVRWISDPQAPRDEDAQSTHSEPHVTILRRALALTQKEFAARFHLPLATLRDWERGLSEPDQPMCAYLTVIALHPEVVSRALRKRARADRLRALATLADSRLLFCGMFAANQLPTRRPSVCSGRSSGCLHRSLDAIAMLGPVNARRKCAGRPSGRPRSSLRYGRGG